MTAVSEGTPPSLTDARVEAVARRVSVDDDAVIAIVPPRERSVRFPGRSVRIRRGVVVVRTRDGRHRFDLDDPRLKVLMVGTPGRRAWRIQFLRRGANPFEVDSSLVDPHAFTAAVRRWRPTL